MGTVFAPICSLSLERSKREATEGFGIVVLTPSATRRLPISLGPLGGDSILAEIDRTISRYLKRFGEDSLKQQRGISGITVERAALDLVNDLERYPHAFVLACIADRQTKAEIAWSLPHAICKAVGDLEFKTLAGLQGSVWSSVLGSSGHRLAAKMERLLPAAIRRIGDMYDGNAARIWADGSSGVAVARRFLAFDGVGPKIANMAANILIRDFGIDLPAPRPDIAVDTHVRRVWKRLGLLSGLERNQLQSTTQKQYYSVQLRARELNPDWPGELDWPTWLIGRTWCHANRAPACGECYMRSICPSAGAESLSRVSGPE